MLPEAGAPGLHPGERSYGAGRRLLGVRLHAQSAGPHPLFSDCVEGNGWRRWGKEGEVKGRRGLLKKGEKKEKLEKIEEEEVIVLNAQRSLVVCSTVRRSAAVYVYSLFDFIDCSVEVD